MSENTSLPDKPQGDRPQEGEAEKGIEQSGPESQSRVESAVQKLMDKEPERFMEIMGMSMTSIGNPLYPKMTPEHVSQIIELASKHDEHQYELHKTSARNDHIEWLVGHALTLIGSLAFATIVVIVLFLFRDKPDVLIPTLTGIGGFAGGFAGGWGLGSRRKK